MSPALKNMSLRIVDKNQNDIKKIDRFDVVFITKRSPINSLRTKYVKRVIGLPNEWIEIKSNKKNLLKDMYMFSMMGGIKIHKE